MASRRITTVVFAVGLPIVPAAKIERMKGFFLTQLIQKVDPSVKPEQLEIPVDGEGNSKGLCFITMPDSNAARNLAYRCDNMPFDKNTKERVRFMIYDQYEKYIQGTNAPQPITVAKPSGDPCQFSWYLMQPEMLDQIAYIASKLPKAAWFNHNSATLQQIEIPNYIQQCDDISFTSDGSFFITKAGTKLNLYAGEKWQHFTTIDYPNLDSYVNSPCGRFILAKAKIPVDIDNRYMPNGAAIIDILTGKKLVRIPLNKADYDSIAFGAGSHLFTLQDHKLRCYKAKDFKEVVDICQDADCFAPSLTSKLVFTFRKQRETQPPRIAFHSSETNQSIHVVAAFNAFQCDPYWHPTKPLCAVVQQRVVKRVESSSLAIFDLTNEKAIGTFTEDIKGHILCCAWDPTKNICAIIVATESGRQLIVYEISKNITKICQHQCAGVSNIQFSPAGRFIVADDIKSSASLVQFWDTHAGLITSKNLEGVHSLEWDSSGAFLIASSLTASSQSTWYSIFLLDGNQVLKNKVVNLTKIVWRPRSQEALLTEDDLKKVSEKAEEIIAKSGKFGAVDLKSREEDIKQNKIQKLQKWEALNLRPSLKKEVPVQIKFQCFEEFEDKDE
jgi:uncharacterized protein with WD repeat